MKSFIKEFKEFAFRGNVVNLAVGIIIGAAFTSIVTSLTDNILSPIIGLFVGRNFDSLQIVFLDVEVKYGAFISSVISFIIMAFIIFLMVKSMNRLIPTEPTTHNCPFCTTSISVNAVRCPACTSHLVDDQRDTSENTNTN